MNTFLDALEETYGKMTLWEWTRDWMQIEAEGNGDSHMKLEDYLLARSGMEAEANQ